MWGVYDFDREQYEAEAEKALSRKKSISTYSEDWVRCAEEKLKVGDIVYVEYSPDSQKYIYTHTPEYGSVQEIQVEKSEDGKEKKYLITILNHNGDLVNLDKGDLSIYSRGYCMYIEKYVLRHPRTPRADNYTDCMICGKNHNVEFSH